MRTAGLALALAATVVSATDECSGYWSCDLCLANSFCGWCTPNPAIFSNGTTGHQCMDQRLAGWDCLNLYMTDGCVAGYVCSESEKKCVLGEPGEGDSYANCEDTCVFDDDEPDADDNEPHQLFYKCDPEKLICVNSTQAESTSNCDASCSNSTPDALVGLWRGLNVQTGFTVGEWEMSFDETTAKWGPHGDAEANSGTVAQIGNLLRITKDDGSTVYASGANTLGWPTGPETSAITLALQTATAHEAPPEDVTQAMGNTDFDVFVMHKCNDYGADCDFSPAFEASRRLQSAGDDACNVHPDCASCLADSTGLCGWCEGQITYGDATTCGEDGTGCCGGFDESGTPGFSTCDIKYRKSSCYDVACDWSNWTNPVCRPATDADDQTFESCEAIESWCVYSWGQYCDNSTYTCNTVSSQEECESTPGCDPSSPTCDDCTAPRDAFYYCDSAADSCAGPLNSSACALNPDCDENSPDCDPTVCGPQDDSSTTMYACDTTTFQCVETDDDTTSPSFNTTRDCSLTCFDQDVTGVWRALQIEDGFVVDEWDFEFGDILTSPTVKFSSQTGLSFSGKYEITGVIVDKSFGGAEVIFTDDAGLKTTGVFSSATGAVTKFMYLGLGVPSGDAAVSFDDAMDSAKSEFVLIGCKDGIDGCDFSSAAPTRK